LRASNVYLIVAEEGTVLIDSGMPGSEKKISKYIQSIGLKPESIAYVLITHPDIDHAGSVAEIKKSVAPDAKVAIHEIDAPVLSGEKKAREMKGATGVLMGMMGSFVKLRPVKPDILLKDQEQIAGLTTIFTPGHTSGSVCFHSPDEPALFAGDTLRTDSHGNIEYMSASISFDYNQLVESVKTKLAGMDYDYLLPGHGAPVMQKASEKVRKLVATS
jgi:glyoxylase-like metal-dependent hydrolase (beta-lactamase superfamily II)